jgi:hypothetical protein
MKWAGNGRTASIRDSSVGEVLGFSWVTVERKQKMDEVLVRKFQI